jgi:hypothetical protein
VYHIGLLVPSRRVEMACVCGKNVMRCVSFSREAFHRDQPSDPVFLRLYTDRGPQHQYQPQVNSISFNAAKMGGSSGLGNRISVITEQSLSLPGRHVAVLCHCLWWCAIACGDDFTWRR